MCTAISTGSQWLFLLAVVSVASYLAMRAGAAVEVLPAALPHGASKLFTFLGVLFPTFGAAIAGLLLRRLRAVRRDLRGRRREARRRASAHPAFAGGRAVGARLR